MTILIQQQLSKKFHVYWVVTIQLTMKKEKKEKKFTINNIKKTITLKILHFKKF